MLFTVLRAPHGHAKHRHVDILPVFTWTGWKTILVDSTFWPQLWRLGGLAGTCVLWRLPHCATYWKLGGLPGKHS